MPKYTFKCTECDSVVQENVSRRTNSIVCPKCESAMKRQLPKLGGQSTVNETVDKYTGTTWADGQRESIEERRAKYYWEQEVPRMVRSGTYSIETMLEMGWVYFNDKEEMIINDKPPSER
jgi:putative FmdB family regulatory protein